ncbi:MAG: tetratricopeptide repeat protein [Pyrinomonadaceae bacterium]|nr:tetratricopeptide repeat protein [Pyrinomonadaceae bacterium]
MNALKLTLLIVCLASVGFSQKIHKAKLTPATPTEAQAALLAQASDKYKQKQTDDAIAMYLSVAKSCTECVDAMFGLGLAYYFKKDFDNALINLEKATKYKGLHLPEVYRILGNIADDQGDRKNALKIYGKALKLAPDNELLHYEKGVTLARMGNYDEAKKSLKKSIEIRPAYVSPHYILAEVYIGTKYRVPAMLAAARVLTLESNTPRAKRANKIFRDVFAGGVEKGEKPNSINIFLNLDGPTDEGDFGSIELALGLTGAVNETEDKEKLSDEEKFISKIKSFIAVALETKMKRNFVKDQYFSFLKGISDKAYVEQFSYLLMHQNGNKKAAAYLDANGSKMIEFVEWSKSFRP